MTIGHAAGCYEESEWRRAGDTEQRICTRCHRVVDVRPVAGQMPSLDDKLDAQRECALEAAALIADKDNCWGTAERIRALKKGPSCDASAATVGAGTFGAPGTATSGDASRSPSASSTSEPAPPAVAAGQCAHGVTLASPCMTCIRYGEDDPRGPDHGRSSPSSGEEHFVRVWRNKHGKSLLDQTPAELASGWETSPEKCHAWLATFAGLDDAPKHLAELIDRVVLQTIKDVEAAQKAGIPFRAADSSENERDALLKHVRSFAEATKYALRRFGDDYPSRTAALAAALEDYEGSPFTSQEGRKP